MPGSSPALPMTPAAQRYLLITRIGRRSLHDGWIGGARNFDVMLSCYDETMALPSGPGIHAERRPGRKVAGYDGFLRERADLWQSYDYILMMDEDIATDTGTLNRMFALCTAHDLKIAQPALTWNSHFSYGALLRQHGLQFRHVNFIEMMCPVFRRDVLEEIAPLFGMGLESGIDLIWCNLVYQTPGDFAILDATPVRHTEPVGERKTENGFSGSREYYDDIRAILDRFGLPWLSCTVYSAKTASGRSVHRRPLFFLFALQLLLAIFCQTGIRLRTRYILIHLRHLVLRPPRNIPLSRLPVPLTETGRQTEKEYQAPA